MLKAAVKEIDITPDKVMGIRLAGFGPRKSTGVHERLMAQMLYLSDGKEEVCLCTLDLIGLTHSTVERIRDTLISYPMPFRFIPCCTHTHSGPDTIGFWGKTLLYIVPVTSGVDEEYMEALSQKLSTAAEDLRMDGGKEVELYPAHFTIEPWYTTNARKGGKKNDSGEAFQLRIKQDNHILCTVVNFACHPETLWDDNTLISPDFVGYVRKCISSSGGGLPFFFQGALGGMVTVRDADTSPIEKRYELMRNIGCAIGQKALRALECAEKASVDKIEITRRMLHVPVKAWKYHYVKFMNIIEREFIQQKVRTEVNCLRLGPLQIMTVPGEAIPELGFQIMEKMNSEYKMILGLAADELGYILPPSFFQNKEYSYECSMSCGPDLGSMIVNTVNDMNKEKK